MNRLPTPLPRKGSTRAEPRARAHASLRDRQAHPLLGIFPLAVMAFATLLVVFALAMAQRNSRTDPDLSASASQGLVATSYSLRSAQ